MLTKKGGNNINVNLQKYTLFIYGKTLKFRKYEMYLGLKCIKKNNAAYRRQQSWFNI